MGEGFVVMQSNDVDIYYYMDEPGRAAQQWVRAAILFLPRSGIANCMLITLLRM